MGEAGDTPVFLLIRELASSDLGWFAIPRELGVTKSKQRALNINAAVIDRVFGERRPEDAVHVHARCILKGATHTENRPLGRSQKNWRLGGHAVPGKIFKDVRPGDIFAGLLTVPPEGIPDLQWTVVMVRRDPERHKRLRTLCKPHLSDAMCCFEPGEESFRILAEIMGAIPQRKPTRTVPEAETPEPAAAPLPVEVPPLPPKRGGRTGGRLPLKLKIKQPHILTEILKVSATLSAEAQSRFVEVIEAITGEMRKQLEESEDIRKLSIDHGRAWGRVKGRRIAFIDGGVASLAALGAAPVAIRVGCYQVIPGDSSPDREKFSVEKQLVDELYETAGQGGFYDDLFDDTGKLRDVARMSLETAAACGLLHKQAPPDFILMQGALVNPVSPYATKEPRFPDFSKKGLSLLFPDDKSLPEGKDANFVRTYLRQIKELMKAPLTAVCGVVERASISSSLTRAYLERLREQNRISLDFFKETTDAVRDYRLTDTLMFQCLLEEGEYVVPLPVDRNDPRRASPDWYDEITSFPKPHVTFLHPGRDCLPVRVETFDDKGERFETIIDLVLHSSRLLPNYAFPAGLDIADKFSKIPDWMAKPVNSRLAVQLLRKAVESGQPKLINEMRRLLSGNMREWYLRPGFERG